MNNCPSCEEDLGTAEHICGVTDVSFPGGIVKYEGKPIRIEPQGCEHYWFEADREWISLEKGDSGKLHINFQCHNCGEQKTEVVK